MNLKKKFRFIFYILLFPVLFLSINLPNCFGFPIYAQQGYENPRESTGRIVCANCHLAQKPVQVEVPQAVLPNDIFKVVVKIPYPDNSQQLLDNGKKGPLNVGAIVILPEGFQLAPKDQISKELQAQNKSIYIQPYSKSQKNILVVGPVAGDTHREIVFPIIAPDPAQNKNIHFLKYSVYAGGNRGRGQIYPTGEKSNNNIITASIQGKINKIDILDNGSFNVSIEDLNRNLTIQKIPPGMNLNIVEGDYVKLDQALTKDPNIGGFGQDETEIVLQSPTRIQGMIIFFFIIITAQIFFILKKKQFEKVQAIEINF